MNINHFCMKCMEGTLNESGICTSCGANDAENGNMHLPVRSILNGKYLVGNVIGEGGFGITYIGFDLALEIRVAIKEFCPKGLVGREAEDGMTVYPYNEDAEEAFEKEKNKVINEARRLAKFRNEAGVVSVRDYFIENGTAYIVMDYIEGMTLKKYLKTLKNSGDGCMSMEEVLKLFRPLMETLTKIHRENIIHRDISPDNIMISKEFKKVYLIDFGTARDTLDGHTMSIYSKSFYTPIEQDSEKMKQGPWTDVYALCATIYICITGRRMPLAGDRQREDDLVAPREYGAEISAAMEATLLKGLAVYPEDRIQSVEELMKAFYGENHADYEEASNPQRESWGEKTSEESREQKEQKTESSPKEPVDPQKVAMERMKVKAQLRTIRNKEGILSMIVFAVLLFYMLFIIFQFRNENGAMSIMAFAPVIVLFFAYIGAFISMQRKENKCLFWQKPTEEQIALQVELMRKEIVYIWKNDGYKEDREKYLEQYCKYFDEKGHGFHTFIIKLDKGLKMTVNRFELLDYFNNTILPSPQISDELKAEWKKAAIESWVLIEQ